MIILLLLQLISNPSVKCPIYRVECSPNLIIRKAGCHIDSAFQGEETVSAKAQFEFNLVIGCEIISVNFPTQAMLNRHVQKFSKSGRHSGGRTKSLKMEKSDVMIFISYFLFIASNNMLETDSVKMKRPRAYTEILCKKELLQCQFFILE